MPASMVLPGDVEFAVLTTLSTNLSEINIEPISDADFNDDDQLVCQLPAIRSRYAGTMYRNESDSQQLTYDASHFFEVWCAAEDLTSKAAQRTATLVIVGQVLPLLAGARLTLPDTSVTEPVSLKSVGKRPDDILGTIFIVTVEICAIAQFPGTLAAGSEDN